MCVEDGTLEYTWKTGAEQEKGKQVATNGRDTRR